MPFFLIPEAMGIKLPPPPPLPTDPRTAGRTFGAQRTGAGGEADVCKLADAAAAAGKDPRIVAALQAKCRALASTRGDTPTGYPEPSEGVSPLLIAAGVAAVGVIGFVAYRKLR